MNWNHLTFSYTKTNTMLCCYFRDGAWTPVESHTDDTLRISAFAGALHYAIECFEGLKAFRGKDGKVRIFRPEENAKRMQRSARYLGMEAPPIELFVDMCVQAVKENIDFLPPYESKASLYLRPTLIGYKPQLGVRTTRECMFLMLCSPVGAYVGGNLEPVDAVIARNYDRAAQHGSGSFKIGANYANSLYSLSLAQKQGYKAILYLDPLTKTKIDEFHACNFFGIKDNTYITPESSSVLPSITNASLEIVAKHLGMKVERRPVPVEELATLEEAGECGTAVVITPLSHIDDKPFLESDEVKRYSFVQDGCGPVSQRLYDFITGIQFGEIEDPFDWNVFVE